MPLQLALELLRPSAQPRQLRRRTLGTRLGRRLAPAAVMAAQGTIAVEDERDVAVGAADRRAACAAVQRRRDPSPVQEQDRLAAALGDLAELGEPRRRE